MKDLIEKYKEFKTDRRKVGLYKLGFWIIFFVFLIILYNIPTGSKKTKTYNNNDNIDTQEEIMDKYAFSYKVNDIEYTGTYYENSIELISDTCSFYLTDDKVYTNKEDCLIPDYTYLNINNMEELRNNSELESEKSYKDGKEEYEYTSENNLKLTYIKNTDNTINADMVLEDKEISIYYYDFNKVELSFDSEKYLYELKEVENEY